MPARAEFVEVVTRSIDTPPPAETMPGLQWLGGIEIEARDESKRVEVGNFSGLEYLPDGRLLAVSDEGDWFLLKPKRGGDGRLVGIESVEREHMLDDQGSRLTNKASPIADKKYWVDVESVRLDPAGGLLVSFERSHRLWRYSKGSDVSGWTRSAAELVPAPTDHFVHQPANGGIEAMAVWPDGRVLLISEHQDARLGERNAWLRIGGQYKTLSFKVDSSDEAKLRIEERYTPSDAVALPNGDLLVLHHRFHLATCGVAAKVVRVAKGKIEPGKTVTGEIIADWGNNHGRIENMEGIAVGGGAPGETLVWIVSDHNGGEECGVRKQKSLLMLFRLK